MCIHPGVQIQLCYLFFFPLEWFHFKFWKYGVWVELKWLLLLGLFTLQEYQQYPSRQPPVIDPGLILYCLFGGRFRLIDWLICIVYLMHCTYLIIIRNCISWYTDVYKIVYRILSILTVRPAVNRLILMDKEFQKVVILTLTKMIGVNDLLMILPKTALRLHTMVPRRFKTPDDTSADTYVEYTT